MGFGKTIIFQWVYSYTPRCWTGRVAWFLGDTVGPTIQKPYRTRCGRWMPRNWLVEGFPLEFTLIYELRRTATIDWESERFILEKCGFHAEDNNPGDLEIIWTSIDRPDISIYICSILRARRHRTSYSVKRCRGRSRPTPLRIPKAVIFLDGLNVYQSSAGRSYRYPVELTARNEYGVYGLTSRGRPRDGSTEQVIKPYTRILQQMSQEHLRGTLAREDI
jgi:hypothetical protein